MNIPLMNRLIASGHITEALSIVREEIALPFILGYICPAPCEKACHRRSVDEAISICMLKRFTVADDEIRKDNLMPLIQGNGKKVAVIGSGPAGLSAAFYLRRMGYDVTIYEHRALAGGSMRYDIPEEKLPRRVLDEEISCLIAMGIRILTNENIDSERFEEVIMRENDAVILATGDPARNPHVPFSLTADQDGNLFNRKTCVTTPPGNLRMRQRHQEPANGSKICSPGEAGCDRSGPVSFRREPKTHQVKLSFCHCASFS